MDTSEARPRRLGTVDQWGKGVGGGAGLRVGGGLCVRLGPCSDPGADWLRATPRVYEPAPEPGTEGLSCCAGVDSGPGAGVRWGGGVRLSGRA